MLDFWGRRRYKPQIHAPGYIYLMRCGHLYKVGRSIDPNNRLAQIKADRPKTLLRAGLDPRTTMLIYAVATGNMYQAERTAHAKLERYRCESYPKKTRPEWFTLDAAAVAWFCSLHEDGM